MVLGNVYKIWFRYNFWRVKNKRRDIIEKKIGYLVEGFYSKEEREEFRKKIMVIRGKTGKPVVEVLIEAINKYEEGLK